MAVENEMQALKCREDVSVQLLKHKKAKFYSISTANFNYNAVKTRFEELAMFMFRTPRRLASRCLSSCWRFRSPYGDCCQMRFGMQQDRMSTGFEVTGFGFKVTVKCVVFWSCCPTVLLLLGCCSWAEHTNRVAGCSLHEWFGSTVQFGRARHTDHSLLWRSNSYNIKWWNLKHTLPVV